MQGIMGRRKISEKQIMEELAAIGFARATDYLQVENGELVIRSTGELKKEDQAAIASVERTSNGIRLKLYDKMKALELMGKQMGMFEGKDGAVQEKNNLLEAILAATQEEMETDDLPEVQQAADAGHDMVEPSGDENL